MTWKISHLNMGSFALDGGAMFGIVPKPLWSKAYPADADNRIRMQTNCMLLQNQERKVIIEAGNGWGFSAKEREFYNMQSTPTWQEVLKPHGLNPDMITDVIVTHLHFDHACGLSQRDAQGKCKLSFPNATHYVQKRQFDWSQKPTEKDRGSYRAEGVEPFIQAETKKIFLDGDVDVMSGIRVQTIDGHSPGQQLIHVESDRGHYVFVADLTPTTAHFHLPWIMAYDLQPLTSLEEKRRFLTAAHQEQWILWLYHDAYHLAVKVDYDGKRFRMGEVVQKIAV